MLRTSHLGKALAFIVLLGSAGLALPAKATLVLDLGPGGATASCPGLFCGGRFGRTIGWVFDLSGTIEVNGLAAWDSNAAAFNSPFVPVGLWNDSGTRLANANILPSSPTEPSSGDGVWRTESIPTLILTPGRYVLGQVFYNEDPLITTEAPITAIPEVTVVAGRLFGGGADTGLAFPEASWPAPAFGPNLRLVPAQLPEPATIALFGFGLGLVGIGSLIRRRRGL